MGKMAVLALLFCSWRCLLHVCLDYQKIGELCVIIGEPSLPVAVVSVDRHLSLRSRRRTSSASVLSQAGTTCNIYFTRSSGKEADFSFFLQLQSCPFTHASSVTNIFVCQRGQKVQLTLGQEGGKQVPTQILQESVHLEH